MGEIFGHIVTAFNKEHVLQIWEFAFAHLDRFRRYNGAGLNMKEQFRHL